jgi:nitroimidazol reductase NimA-like FMN-containing flavoprotein (pyridoxamine 5'-phosphate oxidase superfamily)
MPSGPRRQPAFRDLIRAFVTGVEQLSRRDQIKMTDTEVHAFLADERTVTCATNGSRGWPHTMPLWYVLRDAPTGEPGPRLWAWTYAASQKARNLERDPRATLQVEAGEQYHELRGVMIECEAILHDDLETVRGVGMEIFRRYVSPRGRPPASELPDEVAAMVSSQAHKRVGLEFLERRRATWDHRKLGERY